MRPLLHLHIPSFAGCKKNSFLKKTNTYFFLLMLTAISPAAFAQKHDTLETVRIPAKKGRIITKAPTPVQLLNRGELDKRNSISIADAVKYFAGVNVKDYGGIGGLKTISVRSLGANHTGVMYDGLLLGDAQGGQADLGKFSLDNVQEIRLSNAGPSEILLPARAFASGALLSVNTVSASGDTSPAISFGIRQGSFGYISPFFALKTFIGKNCTTGFSGTYQQAKGNYPFKSYENGGGTKQRNNSVIKAIRLEYDVALPFNDTNRFRFKAYYYQSKRGLPGAVVFYNNSPGNQKLHDENIFFQASHEKKLSAKSYLLLSAKYSADNYYYIDPAYPNSFGKLENRFHQKEIYFSAGYKYDLTRAFSASFASDLYNSRLKRTDLLSQGFADPKRNTFLNNLALRFVKNKTEASGNVLYTVINEKVSAGKAGRNLQEFSPALAVSVAPFRYMPMRFRAFYKKIFRAPTFNDLYYTNIGNTALRPEFADQYNAGITFNSRPVLFMNKLVFTGDAYLNNVKDKILAVPRQNLFQWSMQNIGAVRIKGADLGLHIDFNRLKQLQLSSGVTYSFQQSLDVSNKNSSLYGTQLPYTPKHSGSFHTDATYKALVLSYNILFSSYRYRAGDAIPENLVQGWSSNDISLGYSFTKNRYAGYKILAEANNIFNTQYEIIKYYPMPRFNYRLSLLVSIHNKIYQTKQTSK